ncbi:MAG: hypothetical protein ABSH44_03580 [Bryobacteraceae bacterium]|jgi:hypothetical protein
MCGLLAFCPTLSASSAVFVLGNQNNSNQNYTVSGQGTVPAGPYAGTLTNSDSGVTSSITLFFCLNGDQTTQWTSTNYGTEAAPSTQAQEEAAFLGSLVLYYANQNGITLTTNVVNNYESLTQGKTGSMDVPTFVSTYEGPISMAIWEIMGSLPTGDGITKPDPAADQYVTKAQAAWTNLLQYSSNSLVQTFNNNVLVFTPSGSGQSFVTAFRDDALVVAAMPEPGTMVLFAAGVLLIAIGRTSRLARRRSARNHG